jgi:ATP-dependent DNA helicase RecQ
MEKHLKDIYGFNNFRGSQKEIINNLLEKKDVFAILPTGGGKSLLYQFPATFTDKITIVVSPLISLMNDQCKYLNSKNIKTLCLNSEYFVPISQYINYKIIYTTPEFIVSRLQAFILIKEKIGLFAIDEAHCVSQWSHDFRTSYQQLGIIKKKFPKTPLLAVTATATPRVLKEMYEFLNITNSEEYSLGTRRTNLAIKVLDKSEFYNCSFTEPTIVYVQTRKLCEKLCEDFKRKGILTACYHGGMEKNDKEKSHELFIKGEIIVIVATISFGMGIDKSDIRHVVNYGVPANIESYYQEIGRAGRDGINSRATIYYKDNDFTTTSYLISKSPDPEQIKIKTLGMNRFRNFLQERNICRQQMIDYYFSTGEMCNEEDVTDIPKCNMCDNCLTEKRQKLIDVSDEAVCIVNVISDNFSKKRHDFGLKKTISNIQSSRKFVIHPKRPEKRIKDVIDVLIKKNVLSRYKAGRGFAIGMGMTGLKSILPLKARMDECTYKINTMFCNSSQDYLKKTMELRNKIANKFNLVPSTFINDRVIMNINDKSPNNIKELWKVDGISNEFIMTPECGEFMAEYVKIKNNGTAKSPRKKKRKGKTKTHVLSFYKQGKTIKEISRILEMKEITIEGHVLSIFENDENIDIDMDYFGLTEEKEEVIKRAIKKVGKKPLRPIKDEVGYSITYAQIKLCILVMDFESDN